MTEEQASAFVKDLGAPQTKREAWNQEAGSVAAERLAQPPAPESFFRRAARLLGIRRALRQSAPQIESAVDILLTAFRTGVFDGWEARSEAQRRLSAARAQDAAQSASEAPTAPAVGPSQSETDPNSAAEGGASDAKETSAAEVAYDKFETGKALTAGEMSAVAARLSADSASGVRETTRLVMDGGWRYNEATGLWQRFPALQGQPIPLAARYFGADGKWHGAKREGGRRFADSPRYSIASAPSPAELADARRQYDAVVARYTNPDGTKKPVWMRAPNGKPTKLTERQWVQVRTPNFKRWFGDWEAAAEIAAMRKRIADWTANPEDLAWAKGKTLAECEARFGSDMEPIAFVPEEFVANFDGAAADNRIYSSKGYLIDHMANHGHADIGAAEYMALQEMFDAPDEIIKDTRPKPNGKPRDSLLFVKSFGKNRLAAVELSARDGYIVLHKSLYNTKGRVYPSLPRVALSGGGRSPISQTGSPAPGGSLSARGNTASQAHFVRKVNPASFSKVVDENGEPLVVWHGTGANFTEFKPGTKGKLGPGIYLTTLREKAERHSHLRGRGYGDEITMPLFANIRNPAFAHYESGRFLPVFDKTGNADGIILGDSAADALEIKAISPSQIKSATDNAGTFSGSDPDIRYSISGLYTGSAADYAQRDENGNVVNRPSLVHVGTGEGTQVYGWGLYASNRRGVAEWYARRDATIKQMREPGRTVLIDGISLFDIPEIQHTLDLLYAIDAGMSLQEIIEEEENEDGWDGMGLEPEELKFLKEHVNSKVEIRTNAPVLPNLYEQTFFTNRPEGDESHLLKWYEAVPRDTFDRIVSALKEEGRWGERDGGRDILGRPETIYGTLYGAMRHSGGEWTGGDVYELVRAQLGADENHGAREASEWLAAHGIDGVKYPVDSYGGKGVKDGDDAGWNYVSFRDDNIRVDHKWTDGVQRYSVAPVSPEQDAAYMDAVRRGDMETAQRMVDEADKKSGYVVDVYHGTQKPGFYTFDAEGTGGVFVSNDPKVSKTYVQEVFGEFDDIYARPVIKKVGSRPDMVAKMKRSGNPGIYHLALRPGKTLEIDAGGLGWNQLEGAKGLPQGLEKATFPHLKNLRLIKNSLNGQISVRAVEDDESIEGDDPQTVMMAYLRHRGVSPEKANDVIEDVMFGEELRSRDGSIIEPATYEYTMPFPSLEEANEFLRGLSPYFGATDEELQPPNPDYPHWPGIKEFKPALAARIDTRKVAAWAKANGFEAVHFANVVDNGANGLADASDVWWVASSNQLKMRNPVTYDDAGNVIPLSQRFNPAREDIRYSVGARALDWEALPNLAPRVASSTGIGALEGSRFKEERGRVMPRYDEAKRLREAGDETKADAILSGLEDEARALAADKRTEWLGKYLLGKYHADTGAAKEVVKHYLKPEAVAELKAALDPSRPVVALFPLTNVEGKSLNRLPFAYAGELARRLDARVDTGLLKKNSQTLTRKGQNERASADFEFDTAEIDFSGNPQIIIVDDTWTSGQTTVSAVDAILRAHPDADIRAVTALAAGRYGKNVKPAQEQLTKVLKKSTFPTVDALNAFLGYDIRRATGSELHGYLLNGRSGPDGIRERFGSSAPGVGRQNESGSGLDNGGTGSALRGGSGGEVAPSYSIAPTSDFDITLADPDIMLRAIIAADELAGRNRTGFSAILHFIHVFIFVTQRHRGGRGGEFIGQLLAMSRSRRLRRRRNPGAISRYPDIPIFRHPFSPALGRVRTRRGRVPTRLVGAFPRTRPSVGQNRGESRAWERQARAVPEAPFGAAVGKRTPPML